MGQAGEEKEFRAKHRPRVGDVSHPRDQDERREHH